MSAGVFFIFAVGNRSVGLLWCIRSLTHCIRQQVQVVFPINIAGVVRVCQILLWL